LIELVEIIINYFIENKARNLPNELEHLKEYKHCKESFTFCPHFLLKNFSEERNYKDYIIKLYLKGRIFS